jgi:hypothetical protein
LSQPEQNFLFIKNLFGTNIEKMKIWKIWILLLPLLRKRIQDCAKRLPHYCEKAYIRDSTDDAWCGMVYICKSPSSWEPQEEGMMSTATSFSLSKKPRFIDPKRSKPN